MWSMRTSASAPAMRTARNRVSAPAVCSAHTPAPTQTVHTRVFASAGRCGHSPASDPAPCSRSDRVGPAGLARSTRVRVPAAPAEFDRASTPAVRAGRSSISTRSERSRRAEPATSHGGSWASARAVRSRWQGAAITYRSSPSNVLRATRGPEADRPSRTPVRSILRGFVTHRACRLSARHCILNGIDALSPDGRNRPTTRGVEV